MTILLAEPRTSAARSHVRSSRARNRRSLDQGAHKSLADLLRPRSGALLARDTRTGYGRDRMGNRVVW